MLTASDRDGEGALQPTFEARQMPGERRAIATARKMAQPHVGVIASSRKADPLLGEYWPSEEVFRHGVSLISIKSAMAQYRT